ncbi:hypothetical protein R1sor_004254 [Riccia sorocarpa]|uniref:Uncharacterized protein n=1 Tax=Riccia sorocarpa TaxID=122646 RepID=A0ABD3H6T1_9MARC
MTGMSDDVIDHVTTEYLREAQYNGPPRLRNASFSYTSGAPGSDDWRPTGSIRGSLSSGEVHGRPVPGDRDFGRSHQGISNHRGGSDSFSFLSEASAPDRLVEMMKMLRIMRSAHERNFGSRKVPGNLKQGAAGSGLEEEHKQYVEKLGNEWRDVARILRCKSKQKDESAECSVSEVSSAMESCYSSEVVEMNGSGSNSNFAPAEFGNFGEVALSADVLPGKAKDIVEDEHVARVRESEGKVPVNHRDEGGHVSGVGEVLGQIEDDDERQDGLSESSRIGTEVFGEDNSVGPEVTETTQGVVDSRRGISSRGPNKAMGSERQQEAESCDECDGVDVHGKSIYKETIPQELAQSEHDVYPTSLASSDSEFEKSLIGLDAEEISVGKTPRKEIRRLRSVFSQQPLTIPTDLESPSEKTSDRRTKSRWDSSPFSPFKDRSNIPSGSEQRRTPRRLLDEDRRSKPQPWASGLRTPEKSPKRRASLDPRRRTDPKSSQVSSNVSDDSPDLPVIPKPRLHRSATLDMRLSTHRGKAATEEPKVSTEASKDAGESSTALDIPPFRTPLSSIRVDRTDKDCSTSDQTHRSCTSCQRRRAAINDDRNSLGKSGNHSPSSSQQAKSGRNISAIPDVPSKHSNMEKSTGMKKPNVQLKKASSRLSSSLEFEDSEDFHQTSFPLSSEESPRSTAFPGAPNESKSGSKDTPTFRRSATWNDRIHTPEAKLTPGGPRRGGKVDRVARFPEGPRSHNEPPPFVVPSPSSTQRTRTSKVV